MVQIPRGRDVATGVGAAGVTAGGLAVATGNVPSQVSPSTPSGSSSGGAGSSGAGTTNTAPAQSPVESIVAVLEGLFNFATSNPEFLVFVFLVAAVVAAFLR